MFAVCRCCVRGVSASDYRALIVISFVVVFVVCQIVLSVCGALYFLWCLLFVLCNWLAHVVDLVVSCSLLFGVL